MTFPSVPKGLPAKLCLLLPVSAFFPRAPVSATLHPRSVVLALGLQHGRGGSAVLIAIIGLIGTVLAAIIMSRRSGKG
jgi:hypothetical protein